MDSDAKFFSSLGLNCIRLPFNYRHFEGRTISVANLPCVYMNFADDMNPRVLKESGFKHLDRVIELCASYNIYTILDLHTAPGGLNSRSH
jgi:aryl-phospho-beta-D-glucosidase BglC (GH1 family)